MLDKDSLYRDVNNYIKQLDGKLALSLYSPFYEFYFSVNDKDIYPAASLIKLPIMAAIFYLNLDLEDNITLLKKDKVPGAGVLQYLKTPKSFTLKDLIYLMIVISDNTATNLIIDYIGIDKLNYIFKEVFKLKDTILGSKLMITPHLPTKNFTTAYDMFLVNSLFTFDNLLPSKYKQLAVEILKKQEFREKIPALLWDKDIEVANKTGEISGVREDSAIIFLDNQNYYLLTILTKEVKDPYLADLIIAKISLYLYNYIANFKG